MLQIFFTPAVSSNFRSTFTQYSSQHFLEIAQCSSRLRDHVRDDGPMAIQIIAIASSNAMLCKTNMGG